MKPRTVRTTSRRAAGSAAGRSVALICVLGLASPLAIAAPPDSPRTPLPPSAPSPASPPSPPPSPSPRVPASPPTAGRSDPAIGALEKQVGDAERGFARSMADRDPAAFARYLSEDAVFLSDDPPLRGKAAVVAGWRPLFEGAKAPFSWEPDQAVVLGDGTLAATSGPVRDPEGRITARFHSIWRQETPGVWRIVFDRGGPWEDAEPEPDGR